MKPNVTIRSFAPADEAACAGIYDRAWHAGHPWAPKAVDVEAFRALIRSETVLVADNAGRPGGFVAMHEPATFIHSLYVEPLLHGQGIGSALLRVALERLGGRATLKCQLRSERSIGFYRRLGWTEGERGESSDGQWVRMTSPAPSQRVGSDNLV